MNHIKFLLLMLAAVALLLPGCADWCKPKTCPPAAKTTGPCPLRALCPPAAKASAPCPPCGPAGMARTAQAFPAAQPGSAVCLERMAPSEVQLNESFDYQFKVTNLTNRCLQNVMVKDHIPAGLSIRSSTPQAQAGPNGMVTWMLGDLEAKASKTINVSAVASSEGALTSCAQVTYDSPVCAKINVVQPRLTLTKSAPADVLVCDRIPLKYCVTNSGSGHACDVTVKDPLQEGLTTSDGRRELMFTVNSLGPGQSRGFEAMVNPSKTGVFASRAVATARGSMMAESDTTSTTVHQPVLAITHSGPDMQYVGRCIAYEITVANRGDGTARDAVLEVMVPDEATFNTATESGRFSRSSPGKVTWNLGMLEPGQSKKVAMTLTGSRVCPITTTATAKAYCAETVSSSVQTNVCGIPGILLEMVDTCDPVEVGQIENYVITVTNQGSSTDTNIQVTCMLEQSMEYVSSSGPTEATVTGNTITFAPLASLAPKAQVKWQVNIRAMAPAEVRFKTTLASDQLKTRPVEETEATTFYKCELTP